MHRRGTNIDGHRLSWQRRRVGVRHEWRGVKHESVGNKTRLCRRVRKSLINRVHHVYTAVACTTETQCTRLVCTVWWNSINYIRSTGKFDLLDCVYSSQKTNNLP